MEGARAVKMSQDLRQALCYQCHAPVAKAAAGATEWVSTLFAEAPELPGCAAHGATQEDALGNALDAIRLWIDTAKEFGDPIPEPRVAA